MKTKLFNYSVIQLIVIVLLSITGFSCKENCDINRPKNLKPIDWENYNDPYTVYWNGLKNCSEPGFDDGTKIKVSGWIRQCANVQIPINPDLFALTEEKYMSECNGAKGTILHVRPYYSDFLDSLKIILNTNLEKKCYINGILSYNSLYDMGPCCHVTPEIIIYSVDDIKFEEE